MDTLASLPSFCITTRPLTQLVCDCANPPDARPPLRSVCIVQRSSNPRVPRERLRPLPSRTESPRTEGTLAFSGSPGNFRAVAESEILRGLAIDTSSLENNSVRLHIRGGKAASVRGTRDRFADICGIGTSKRCRSARRGGMKPP